jgi:ABC-type polysaccharide/polyol phosphate export permease
MTASLQKTVLTPNRRFEAGTVLSFFRAASNQIRQRDMIYQLFKKEFFAGYAKSFIGSAWIVVTPILGIVSWVFLHRAHIIRPGNVGIPYPAYILVGTLVWGLFMNLTSSFMNALSNSRYLLLWTPIPHETVFSVQIVLQAVHFSISLCVTIIFLVLFGIFPSWGILFFPVVVIPLVILAMAVGCIVSIFSVISLDIRKVITALLGLLLFITPVIYSTDAVTNVWLRKIIYLNPLTYLVCSARDILLFGTLYSPAGFWVSTMLSAAAGIISWRVFYVSEDKIIERLI